MENSLSLRIPKEWVDACDWTDREKVFLAMLFILIKDAKSWNTRFYMHWNDFRILNRYHGVTPSGHSGSSGKLNRLRKILEIGLLNEFTVSIEPKPYTARQGTSGFPAYYEVDITDTKAIQVWFYILGRYSGGNMVEDHNEEDELVYKANGNYVLDFTLRSKLRIMKRQVYADSRKN